MTSEYRDQLLQLKTALEAREESSREAGKTVELDQARVGRLSRMDALQIQQMAQAGERQRQQQLRRINAALQRIREGSFGYCLDCGEAIDPRRLAIDPSHSHCVSCSEARDQ